jgi:hypothetical protein
MRFRSAFIFGGLAIAATLFGASDNVPLGAVSLLVALPLWLLFIVFLIRALRP